uniref:Uncharacterized protein n=1 Tax=Triticum urartu TaxID=4572 RepID=A0A8R7USD8_TRIUA
MKILGSNRSPLGITLYKYAIVFCGHQASLVLTIQGSHALKFISPHSWPCKSVEGEQLSACPFRLLLDLPTVVPALIGSFSSHLSRVTVEKNFWKWMRNQGDMPDYRPTMKIAM